jgi:Flp pilus assembly protein TadG
MRIHQLIRKLRDQWSRFRRAERGNVAIIFALSFIPIIGLIGAAFDYSRLNAARTSMQAAVDSTALAMSLLMSQNPTTSAADLQTKAQAYFNAAFTRKDVVTPTVTVSYTTSGGNSVSISASSTMTTQLVNSIGIKSMPVSASSSTAWGSARLRVALVLDNTGSMADNGKIGALITATNNLLGQLKAATTTSADVYVSIIPFVKDVAVDTINYTASWIDWTDWESPPANSTPSATVGPGSNCPYSNSYGSTRSDGVQCTTGPVTGSSTTRTIPSTGTYKGYICPSANSTGRYYNGCYDSTTYSCTGNSCSCTGHNNCTCSGNGSNKVCKTNSGYYEHTWNINPHSTWDGCLTDRGTSTAPSSGNYDTNVATPTTTDTSTMFPAEQYAYCPKTVLPLTNNWTAMTNLVNSMTPAGNTNQAIGLAHGWMSLVGGGPYPAPPAMDSNYTYQQIIILLTDGLNTQDRWSTTQTWIDGRQQTTCDNINAAKITLYTVQVNTSNDPTSTLLQNCAGTGNPHKYPDPSKNFLVTSSGAIGTTFSQIGSNLSQLRVAK